MNRAIAHNSVLALSGSVLALSGGIGGAKLALGLHRILPPGSLRVVVNTGDDFEHLGLLICPDVDTTLYTLAGLANPQLGWGRADETWSFMGALQQLGGESWFNIGDKDLALHVERTRRVAAGETLTAVTADVARRLGIASAVLPMSDAAVRTVVETDAGTLSFQHYFVRERCAPRVTALRFVGAQGAAPSAAALDCLRRDDLAAVILCPSNPYLSVDPMLAMPAWRAALRECTAPIIAVSPLIGGQAVKGPTAKIMRELGLAVSPVTVAEHYADFIDGFVLDEADRDLAPRLEMPVLVTRTLMQTSEDKERLASEVLEFASSLVTSLAPRP